MDELEQIAADVLGEGTPPPELPPDDGALPEQAEPESDLAERLAAAESAREQAEREREEARQAAEVAERRMRDSHASWQQMNMAKMAAEAAAQVFDRYKQKDQPQPEPPRAPMLTPEQKEEIYSDPDLLERHILGVARFAHDLAVSQSNQKLAEIQPVLEAAQETAVVFESVLPIVQEQAVGKAREIAAKEGLTGEDFEKVLPRAHELIVAAAQDNRAKYRTLSTNPEAVLMAVKMARSQNGVPITQKPQIPPTIGAKPPTKKPAPAPKPPALLKMERDFNMTFSDEDVAEYNRKLKAGRP